MTRFERSLLIFAVGTLIVIALGLLCPLVQAFAAEAPPPSHTVTVPWGEWLAAAAPDATTILAAVVLWALRQIPGEVGAWLRTRRVEQLLERAIGWGVNTVAGAARDKVLKMEVASDVLAEATQYAIERAPRSLIAWMGGRAAITDMIWARLQVEEGAGLTAEEALEYVPEEHPGFKADGAPGNVETNPSGSSLPSGASPAGGVHHPV